MTEQPDITQRIASIIEEHIDCEKAGIYADGLAKVLVEQLGLDREPTGRLCSYCDGTGIVPGYENATWIQGQGWVRDANRP